MGAGMTLDRTQIDEPGAVGCIGRKDFREKDSVLGVPVHPQVFQ